MIEAYKKFWQNYFDFSGVATRSDYWYVWLFNLLLGLIMALSMGLCETEEIFNLLGDLYGIYCLLIIIPSISILFRRLHDSGHSGWYCLFLFVPLIGTIVLLILLCSDTKIENNKYTCCKKRSNNFIGKNIVTIIFVSIVVFVLLILVLPFLTLILG